MEKRFLLVLLVLFSLSFISAFGVSFLGPTPDSGVVVNDSFVFLNASLFSSSLFNASFFWGGDSLLLFDDSLLLSYSFDNRSFLGEGSVVVDDSLFSHNASLTGSASYVSGRFGSGLDVGVGDALLSSANDSLMLVGTNFTLSSWVKPDSVNANYMIFGNNFESGGYQFQIFNGPLTFRYGSGPSLVVSSNVSLSTGVWSHVVATYDVSSDFLQFYINGVPSGSGSINALSSGGGTTFYVGSDGRDGSGYEFDGVLDDLRVYNRFFGASDVSLLFSSSFSRGNSSSWFFVSNRTSLSNGTYEYALSFANSSGLFSSSFRNVTVLSSSNSSGGGSNESNSSGSLSLSYPLRYVVVQRVGSVGNILLEGSYTGSPSSLEARFNGGSWVMVASNLSGGTFSGVLENQSQGQGLLEVRFSDNVSVTDTVEDVGIGDVFAIGGQSNAEMRGYNAQSLNYSLSFNATVYREDDAWKLADDPVDTGTSVGSSWPLLANLLVESEGIPVAFISASAGGSAITEWQKGDYLYNNLVSQVSEATRGTGLIRAVLFFQGERDAASSGSGCNGDYSCYYDNVVAMSSSFLSDTNASKVLVGQMNHQPSGSRDGNDAVRRAQRDAWDLHPNVSFGVSTYDISLADGLHFKTDQQLSSFAYRWFASLGEHFYGSSLGRGPVLLDAEFFVGSSELVLVFDQPLNQSTGTEGWRFLSGASVYGDVNVVNVSFPSNTSVSLLLDVELSSGSRLFLGSGSDGQDKNVLRGLSSFSLPAEMVFNESIGMVFSDFSFVDPTPSNGGGVSSNTALINVSIGFDVFSSLLWSWNNSNFTFFDDSLWLLLNADNVSSLGDSSSLVSDVSSYGYDASLFGPSYCSGVSRVGLCFVGSSNDSLQFGDVLDLGSSNVSFEFWINRSSNSSSGLFSKADPLFTVDSSDGYVLYLDDIGFLNFKAQSYEVNARSSSVVPVGSWSHIVVVLERFGSSNTVSFYINGELAGVSSASGGGINISSAHNLTFGSSLSSSEGFIPSFDGVLDEVRFYGFSFSSSDVFEHYHSFLFRDATNHWSFLSNRTGLREGLYDYGSWLVDSLEVSYGLSRYVNVSFPADATPPSSVSGISSSSGLDWLFWSWSNPSDSDFDVVFVFVDGVNVLNTSSSSFNLTGLVVNSSYNLSLQTVDYSGNVNDSFVGGVFSTLPDTFAPSVLSSDPVNDATLPSSITSYKLVLDTDEDSFCRYSLSSSNWSLMDVMPVTGGLEHNVTVSLSSGTYDYLFLCEDVLGNRMSSPFVLHFVVASPSLPSGGGSSGGGGGSGGGSVSSSFSSVESFSFTPVKALVFPDEDKSLEVVVKNLRSEAANKCSLRASSGFESLLDSSKISNIGPGEIVEFPFVFHADSLLVDGFELFLDCLDNVSGQVPFEVKLVKSEVDLRINKLRVSGDDLLVGYDLESSSFPVLVDVKVFDGSSKVVVERRESLSSSGELSFSLVGVSPGLVKVSVVDLQGRVLVEEQVIVGGVVGTGFVSEALSLVGGSTSVVVVLVFVVICFFVLRRIVRLSRRPYRSESSYRHVHHVRGRHH